MIKKIIGTVGSRGLAALINLLVTVSVIRFLGGAAAVGTMALVVLGITIVVLFNSIVAGAPIVFLSSREKLIKLLLPSYSWILIVGALFIFVFLFFPFLIPKGYSKDIIALATFESIYALHINILLGREKIKKYNFLFIAKSALLLLALLFQIFVLKADTFQVYINSLYFAYIVNVFLSFFAILPFLERNSKKFEKRIVKLLFQYGLQTQAVNLLQLGNYRLAYYLVELYIGRFGLGLYNIATQLSESAWLPGRSLGLLQYSKISNTEQKGEQRLFTLTMLKLSIIVTSALVLVLLSIPSSVYQLIFTNEVADLRYILLLLSPGIVVFSFQFIIAHYFSGNAKYNVTIISTAIGLAVTVALSLVLIPAYGLTGAAISVSSSYIIQSGFLTYFFFKDQKVKFAELLITSGDINRLKLALDSFKKKLP